MIGAPTATAPVDALAVSLNRTSVSGSASTSSVSTNSVSATGSGGDSPYTYLWERVSGDSSITASTASSRTTSFSRTGCIAGTSYSATWHCIVTDDAGDVVYSDNVSITITRTSSGGGGGGGGGSGGGTFNGIADTVVNVVDYGAPQTATYTIKSDGTITTTAGGSATWNSSTTAGSGYEVKATVTSGSLTSGTTGSWLALSSNRSWSKTDSTAGGGDVSAIFRLDIRATGTTTVLDSATITLDAEAL
jgi:hypothetical protein